MCLQRNGLELYFLGGHCFFGEASEFENPLFEGDKQLSEIFQFVERNAKGEVELCVKAKSAGFRDVKRKIINETGQEIKIIVPCLMYHLRLPVDQTERKFVLKRKRPFSVSSITQ